MFFVVALAGLSYGVTTIAGYEGVRQSLTWGNLALAPSSGGLPMLDVLLLLLLSSVMWLVLGWYLGEVRARARKASCLALALALALARASPSHRPA